MNTNSLALPALCVAFLLNASCTILETQESPTAATTTLTTVPRAVRGTEIQTPLADYMTDTEAEFCVLARGDGNTEDEAIAAARKAARSRMGKRIDGELNFGAELSPRAQERLKRELIRALREATPDPWQYDDDHSPKFTALFGVALDKRNAREIEKKITMEFPKEKHLPPPLDNVLVNNTRFPAKISGVANVFKNNERRTFEIVPETATTLTIFCYDEAGNAVVLGFRNKKTHRALRAHENYAHEMVFSLENPEKLRENNVLLFVLTTKEFPFNEPPDTAFPCKRIAEWLEQIPARERFIEPIAFAVER